jgi:hypothetical protein
MQSGGVQEKTQWTTSSVIKEGHDNNNERAVDMRVESEGTCMHR